MTDYHAVERHVAGATVTHTSPYAELSVPTTDAPLPVDVRETWVKPLYFGLQKPHVRPFVASHLHLVDDDLVSQLLTSFDWRPRTAAAYLAALSGRKAFTTRLGRLLLRSDVCFAGTAYCLALAEFNSPESVAFIDEYLSYYLTRKDLWFDQAAAMGAITYLDRVNGTDVRARHLAAWSGFIEDKRNWSLASSVALFEQDMATLRALKNDDSQGIRPHK